MLRKACDSKDWVYSMPLICYAPMAMIMYTCEFQSLTRDMIKSNALYWIAGELAPLILLVCIRAGYRRQWSRCQPYVWWYWTPLFANNIGTSIRLFNRSNCWLQAKRWCAQCGSWFWPVDHRGLPDKPFEPGDGDHFLVSESGTRWWCLKHGVPRLLPGPC